ncbi:hypothetical protein Droror1_Dr00027339 [Drosera rotundifolia]
MSKDLKFSRVTTHTFYIKGHATPNAPGDFSHDIATTSNTQANTSLKPCFNNQFTNNYPAETVQSQDAGQTPSIILRPPKFSLLTPKQSQIRHLVLTQNPKLIALSSARFPVPSTLPQPHSLSFKTQAGFETRRV